MDIKSEKLRSGFPLWKSIDAVFPSYPRLNEDLQCEVLVIGAGISGILIASELVAAGVDVVLADAAEPAMNSTLASTGLLLYEVDTPLLELIRKVGEKNAVRAYQRGLWAITEIERKAHEVGASSVFSRRPSLYFASSLFQAPALKKEYECRKHFGFDVEFWDRRKLHHETSIHKPAAIWSRGDAEIDPYLFSRRVLEASAKKGLRVYGDTKVGDARTDDGGMLSPSAQGSIRSQRVVIATGYEASQFLGEKKGYFHTTYVVASNPIHEKTGWPEDFLFWETARPYLYGRRTSHGHVIVGGADSPYADGFRSESLVERKVKALVRGFEKLFPQIPFLPVYSWAGTFAETKDGLAYIGEHPEHPKHYFALGYGGNGITFSMIAAKLITDLYKGRSNPDAEVFKFGR